MVARVYVLCTGNYLNVVTVLAAVHDADKHVVGVGVALNAFDHADINARDIGGNVQLFLNLKAAGKQAVLNGFQFYSIQLHKLTEPA